MKEFTIPEIPEYENQSLEQEIKGHLDNLTKPRGSLGRLEEIALQFCMCRNSEHARIRKMQLFTVAGDHGVTRNNITPFPKEVTQQMVLNMLAGGAAVSVMCRNAGIWYSVIDAGVDAEFKNHPLLIKRKIGYGTDDFSQSPAMSDVQCSRAIEEGIKIIHDCGADLLGTGEMGIGNSASASAVYSLLLDIDPDYTTGAGTGATGELLEHKKSIVRTGVSIHKQVWDGTPFDALRRCGGFEIAMLTGMIIGAVSNRIPVVIDGFITGAAALCAIKMEPRIARYCLFSHISAESFHREFCSTIGIVPILDLQMRLGEGTGAVLAMQLIVQALNCYHEMATFGSAAVTNRTE